MFFKVRCRVPSPPTPPPGIVYTKFFTWSLANFSLVTYAIFTLNSWIFILETRRDFSLVYIEKFFTWNIQDFSLETYGIFHLKIIQDFSLETYGIFSIETLPYFSLTGFFSWNLLLLTYGICHFKRTEFFTLETRRDFSTFNLQDFSLVCTTFFTSNLLDFHFKIYPNFHL